MPKIVLFRKRRMWWPTWQAVGLAALIALLASWFLLSNLHAFLSVTERADGARILVVDGWVPDHVLAEFFDGFEVGQPYDRIYTTGSALPLGHFLSDHRSFAELSAETLVALGVPRATITAVPSPLQARDRSYRAAVAFRQRIGATAAATLRAPCAVDVLTHGVHGRRTRTIYRKALGSDFEVGVISAAPGGYDAGRWFVSSEGAKAVVTEVVSLAYEWFGPKDR